MFQKPDLYLHPDTSPKKEPPTTVGYSEWVEEGREKGYYDYFKRALTVAIGTSIKERLLLIADAGELEELRREVKLFFREK